MSRSADRRDDVDRTDDGFTLVEVVVAIGIVMVLIAAVVPLLITGIKTTDIVRGGLQEKGLAQTELERMRNLPFHVAPAAGNYVDVLDRYYPNIGAPDTKTPNCGDAEGWTVPDGDWSGYVAPTAARCGWEPPGAFYRTVRNSGNTVAGDPLPTGFVLVVDTQFLSKATPPVAVPPDGPYNTSLVGEDRPETSQLGVTVAVFRTGRTNTNPMTTYTQIARRDQLEPLVRAATEVTAVALGATTPEGLPLTLSAGRLDLDASLTSASRVTATLAGTTTGISTGQEAGGARSSVSAPPSATVAQQDAAAGGVAGAGCDLACWGSTRTSAVPVTAADGLLNAGSPTAPLRATVRDDVNGGLRLAGGTGATYLGARTSPLVKVSGAAVPSGNAGCAPAASGESVRVSGSGWLRTTLPEDPAEASVVETCGLARATTLDVLPTTFAPGGILRVTLDSAAVSCRVAGAGHTATASATYSATVERWTPTGYVSVGTINQSTVNDPLALLPLTTALGSNGTIGDYIASMSSLTASGIKRTAVTGTARVSLPGIVNITSTPVRALGEGVPDELSAITLSVGTMSCLAEDRR